MPIEHIDENRRDGVPNAESEPVHKMIKGERYSLLYSVGRVRAGPRDRPEMAPATIHADVSARNNPAPSSRGVRDEHVLAGSLPGVPSLVTEALRSLPEKMAALDLGVEPLRAACRLDDDRPVDAAAFTPWRGDDLDLQNRWETEEVVEVDVEIPLDLVAEVGGRLAAVSDERAPSSRHHLEPVAHPVHRAEHTRLPGLLFDELAQGQDKVVDGALVHVHLRAPQLVDDCIA